jgi:hypothetical protein
MVWVGDVRWGQVSWGNFSKDCVFKLKKIVYGLIGQPRSRLVTIISVFCSVWLFTVSVCLSVSFVFCQSVGLFDFLSIFLVSICLSVLVSLFVCLFRYFCLSFCMTVCVLIFFVCLSLRILFFVCLFVCMSFCVFNFPCMSASFEPVF